jgi:hypothetical protein
VLCRYQYSRLEEVNLKLEWEGAEAKEEANKLRQSYNTLRNTIMYVTCNLHTKPTTAIQNVRLVVCDLQLFLHNLI